MEKRRAGLRFALAAALTLSAAAEACEPGLAGTRLESGRFVLAFKASPEVSKFFSIEIAVCSKSGPPPSALKVDAHMPDHRHGMNYKAEVTRVGPGQWRATGLMFHMPGKWEFLFDVDGERLSRHFQLSFFSEQEKQVILSHGPWPPPAPRDPSNRVSGKAAAVALGEKLFFEPRLSSTGSVLCATCHAPFRGWQDARPRGLGLEPVDRNTQSLLNVAFQRWYGWDGAHDSLWAQSIRPLLDPREMRSDAKTVGNVVRSLFFVEYVKAFDRKPPENDEELLADVGKALAAFQETLVTGRTPFDDYRDSLLKGEEGPYPDSAKRGLKIFVGKGNCSVCHFGPHFTNGEFSDVGVPFFIAPGKVDPGRSEGIRKLKSNPYNLLGRYNDDPARASAIGTRHVEPQHRNFGEFRVPGLRNVAQTAPYMHNGSLATLTEVVKHYSEINEDRLHSDGEKILRKLFLNEEEIQDLVAFLVSLSEKTPARGRP
jgi:cytochrome c peroxidase